MFPEARARIKRAREERFRAADAVFVDANGDIEQGGYAPVADMWVNSQRTKRLKKAFDVGVTVVRHGPDLLAMASAMLAEQFVGLKRTLETVPQFNRKKLRGYESAESKVDPGSTVISASKVTAVPGVTGISVPLSQLNTMSLTIPVEYKAKRCVLPSIRKGGKPTPRTIRELFPAYWESIEYNTFNALPSTSAQQSYMELVMLPRSDQLAMVTKSMWPANQNAANIATTDYEALGKSILTTLGYPYLYGSSGTAATRNYGVGAYYSFTDTHTWFNPVEVACYLDIYVTGMNYGNLTSLSFGSPYNSGPATFFVNGGGGTYGSVDRFHTSTVTGPGTTEAPTAEGAAGAPGTGATGFIGGVSGVYETSQRTLLPVGSRPKGIDKYFPKRHHIRVVLPPMGTVSFSVTRPESFLDLGEVTDRTTVNNHSYFITAYFHGPYMFSSSTTAGVDDNWGRGPAVCSMKTKRCYRVRFHSEKESLGMRLQTADIRIPVGSAVSLGNVNNGVLPANGDNGGVS